MAKPQFTPEFVQFWTDYPKRWIRSSDRYVKIGKYEAWLEWKKLTDDEKKLALQAVKLMKTGEYVPDPHRWLKKKRFYD